MPSYRESRPLVIVIQVIKGRKLFTVIASGLIQCPCMMGSLVKLLGLLEKEISLRSQSCTDLFLKFISEDTIDTPATHFKFFSGDRRKTHVPVYLHRIKCLCERRKNFLEDTVILVICVPG